MVASDCPAAPNAANILGRDAILAIGSQNMLLVSLVLGVVCVLAFARFWASEKLEVELLFKCRERRAPVLAVSNGCLDVKNVLRDKVVCEKVNLAVVAVENFDVGCGEATTTNAEIGLNDALSSIHVRERLTFELSGVCLSEGLDPTLVAARGAFIGQNT